MAFNLKIGTLGVGLALDDAQFNRAMRGVRKSMKAGAAALGAAASAAGVAVAAGMTMAAKSFADVEHALLKATAVVDQSSDTFYRFMDAAMSASTATEFSAREAAGGLEYLGMAGFTAGQAIAALPGVLDLTTAGQIELGEASRITSDIMTGMRLDVSELGRVNDVLVKTFTSANTTLAGLGTTMKYVGPVAASMGQDIESVATLAATLANTGLDASQVGTSLRMMFVRLVRPTRMTKDVMAELGVTMADSKGEFRDIIDVIGDLEKAQKSLGEVEFAAKIAKLMGTEALTGMQALLAKGTDGLRDFRDMLDAAGGTAESVAEVMRSSMSSQIKIMRGNVENLATTFGQVLAPAIKTINAFLVEQVQEVSSSADAFADFKKFVVTILRVSGPFVRVLSQIAGIAAVIGGAFMEVVTILSMVQIAISDFASRAGFLVGAIGMAIDGDLQGASRVIDELNDMDVFRENTRKVERLRSELGTFFDAGMDGFDALTAGGEQFADVLSDAADATERMDRKRFKGLTAAERAGRGMSGAGKGTIGEADDAVDKAKEVSKVVESGQGLAAAMADLGAKLKAGAESEMFTLGEKRKADLEAVAKEMTEEQVRLAEEAAEIERQAAEHRVEAMRRTLSGVSGAIDRTMAQAVPIARKIGEVLTPERLLSQIQSALPRDTDGRSYAGLEAGVSALSAAAAAPGDPMMKAAAGLQALATSVINAVLSTDKAQAQLAMIGELLQSLVPDDLIETMLQAIDPLIGALHIMSPAFSVLGDLLGPLANIVGRILFFQFKKFGLGVLALMRAIMAVRQGILKAVRGVIRGIKSLIDGINDTFKRLPDIPTDGLSNVINSLSDAISNGDDKIDSIADSFKDLATTGFNEAGQIARREQEEYRKRMADLNDELRNAPAGFRRILDRARAQTVNEQRSMDRRSQELGSSAMSKGEGTIINATFNGYTPEQAMRMFQEVMRQGRKAEYNRTGSTNLVASQRPSSAQLAGSLRGS